MNDEQEYLLVVEDDPDILRLLETTLSFKGYRVVIAHNGREAIEIILREHPALVIADIMMPELDGFGMAHRLRISPPQPDFALRVVPSSVGLRSKSTTVVTVYAIRRDGFVGPIKLALKWAPFLSSAILVIRTILF